jgi:7-cyano-7-deazaguanine synthase
MAVANEDVEALILGTVASDAINPDGRHEFVQALNMLVKAQNGPNVVAPALDLETEELDFSSGVPLSVLGWTFSCHTWHWACGSCRGCAKHNFVMERIRDREV